MRILIGNTGRGGELAVLTSIVHAYRKAHPNAYIEVTTAHNGIYPSLWANSPDIDKWTPLAFRNPMPTGKVIKSPPAALEQYFRQTKDQFDHQEMTSEGNLSPGITKGAAVRPIINNIYLRLKHKPFTLADVERRIFIYPSDDDLRAARQLIETHGDNLVLISHIANSASPILNVDGYQQIADKLAKTHPVAYTGNKNHPPLRGHIDLRGTPFSFIYALSQQLKFFIGPDTATTWICANMPGLLISLRGDPTYPIGNTGLVAGGYRTPQNTVEKDLSHLKNHGKIDFVVNKVLSF